MTHSAPKPLLLLALLALVLAPALPGHAEDDPWVAQVFDPGTGQWRSLTRSRLAAAVAWRMRTSLQEPGSGPTTILRQMVEERAVRQEARRLGLTVSKAEVDAAYVRLDKQVREQSRGAKNLKQMILQDNKSTVAEFRVSLAHQLLKEKIAEHPSNLGDTLPKAQQRRIAQTEVVITELLKRTDVKYGWKTALQQDPTPMDVGIVAKVLVYPGPLPPPEQRTAEGDPITMHEYGEDLVLRLPASQVKQIVEEECKAALTTQVALSIEDMTKVVEEERERWQQWRELTTQEAYRSLAYDEYVKMKYKLDVDQMVEDRYFRGLFGLVQQERTKLTPEEIKEEYLANKDTLYGDAILVTDVEIAFAPQNPLLGERGGRSRKEALGLGNEFLRTVHGGIPFDQMIRDINGRQDMSYRARRLRVRNTNTGRLLFSRADQLKDGQISRPFETLSEVHVMRREKFLPAQPFSEIKEIVREGMAQRRAHEWLQESLENEEAVKIRWPLPEDV